MIIKNRIQIFKFINLVGLLKKMTAMTEMTEVPRKKMLDGSNWMMMFYKSRQHTCNGHNVHESVGLISGLGAVVRSLLLLDRSCE